MSEFYSELSSKPVIKLDFKSLKQDSYEELYNEFKRMIKKLYSSKKYIIDSLDNEDLELFNKFLNEEALFTDYKHAVDDLSEMLYKYYNIKPIILIDEYDVPIERGYINNFYDDVVNLIRNVFSNALKGNSNISFAVMT